MTFQTAKTMMTISKSWRVTAFLGLALFASSHGAIAAEGPSENGSLDQIDFNRQIRPILSDRCFHCHGPDSKNQDSELRFDTEQRVFADLGGYFAIVPGDLAKSELHLRIHSDDENERMPPPDSNRSLSDDEIALMDRWILQGAPFDKHWGLQVPIRPPLPKISDSRWPRNEIDHFILHRLDLDQHTPAPEADRNTLLRRLTLDLTGLPPTSEDVDAFISDQSEDAYEKVVDRLLDSPHYGQRMALPWLDAARYADSAGYQNDFKRSQWPWRDWVVRAFNANMPFDQFSIEQLAGDLLPDPTPDQRLATAFNRNHRINNEGGIIPQEFLVEYVADRVETTGTVWLGMTIGCARCHDHKYDPVTQRDFYQLFAFFHNVPEKGKDGDTAPAPNMPVYTGGTKEEHDALVAQLDEAQRTKKRLSRQNEKALKEWMTSELAEATVLGDDVRLPISAAYYPLDFAVRNTYSNLGSGGKDKQRASARIRGERRRVTPAKQGRHSKAVSFKQGGYLDLGRIEGKGGFTADTQYTWALWVNAGSDVSSVEGPLLSCMTPDTARRGYQLNLVDPGDDQPYRVAFRCFSNRELGEGIEAVTDCVVPRNKFTHVAASYDGSGKAAGVAIYIDGERTPCSVQKDTLSAGFRVIEETLVGAETESSVERGIRDELLANSTLDDIRVYRKLLDPGQVRALFALTPTQVLLSADNQTESAKNHLSQTFSENHDPAYQELLKKLASLKARVDKYEEDNITYVSIMQEMETPRDTHLLIRGAYNAPEESEMLSPVTPAALHPFDEQFPPNRLGLARWLFSDQNPLTARVAINRYWQSYFGTGLVKTSEDFGSQGEPPSHPQLLDWLAVEFRANAWDVKAMQKKIVMSATYRQSSAVTAKLLKADPDNRLLARGPRFRLYAQALRDQALAASGLLVDRGGGPPVMPYQPAGLWDEVSAKGFKYVVTDGDDLYRRSLYTFWRRTVPPPSMMNFDTTAREICSVNLSRTNTPLQAMNLLNDPTYVEAARALAQRMLTEGGKDVDAQIAYGMKLILGSEPSPEVFAVLRRGHADYYAHFDQQPQAAREFISVGNSSPDDSLDPIELAAQTAVASVMLNLDATVTKE